jgi:hypothetical protein
MSSFLSMKAFFWSLAAAALFCAGCDDIGDSLQDRVDPAIQPHVRVFAASQRATYEAARAALNQIGFRFLHGGPAEGKLEALSGLADGDVAGSTQQFSLKAEFAPAADGGTEVRVRLSEFIEEDTEHHPGFTTESPLKDTPLYETFFRYIQQGLRPGAGK